MSMSNECGHADKKHHAHGLCARCYKRAYMRAWRLAHPEHKEERRNRTLLDSYGLTLDQCRELLSAQGGRCAICAAVLQRPQLDHNHQTGAVRGFLCIGCNLDLEVLERSAWRRDAEAYLVSHESGDTE